MENCCTRLDLSWSCSKYSNAYIHLLQHKSSKPGNNLDPFSVVSVHCRLSTLRTWLKTHASFIIDSLTISSSSKTFGRKTIVCHLNDVVSIENRSRCVPTHGSGYYYQPRILKVVLYTRICIPSWSHHIILIVIYVNKLIILPSDRWTCSPSNVGASLQTDTHIRKALKWCYVQRKCTRYEISFDLSATIRAHFKSKTTGGHKIDTVFAISLCSIFSVQCDTHIRIYLRLHTIHTVIKIRNVIKGAPCIFMKWICAREEGLGRPTERPQRIHSNDNNSHPSDVGKNSSRAKCVHDAQQEHQPAAKNIAVEIRIHLHRKTISMWIRKDGPQALIAM